MLIQLMSCIGCIGAADNGDGTYRLDFEGYSREAMPEEIATATAAAQRAAIPSVTRKEMLIALHRVGLLDPIKSAVAASGNIELQIAFDEALTFERGDAFLASMQAAMGKTDAEVDALFALAASIK
jgi:hypothetical protein